MKKLFLLLLFLASPAMAEDTKKPFKYSNGTIEEVIAWKKLAECAAFFNEGYEFFMDNNDERDLVYFNLYEIAFYNSQEVLIKDRKINNDDALTLFSEAYELEKIGIQGALDYHSPDGKINNATNKYFEESYKPCADFVELYSELASPKNK